MKTLLKTLAYILGGIIFLAGLLILAKSPELIYVGTGAMIIGAAILILTIK